MYRDKSFAATTLLVLIIHCASQFLIVTAAAPSSVCSEVEGAVESIVRATTPEVQLEITTSIIRSVAPSVFNSISPDLDVMDSNATSSLQAVYDKLSEDFGRKSSVAGYNSFIGAVSEISVAKAEACKGTSAPTNRDVARLVEEFKTAFGVRNKDISNIRSIFGKLLCIDEGGPPATRKRRQDIEVEDPCLAIPRDECECPEGGIESGEFFCVCEFFDCLDPGDELPIIFGFADLNPDGEQCLAFVIDTTGSMSGEIGTVRQIVNEFLLSEEELASFGCYILMPFNDIDDTRDSSDESVGPIQVTNPQLVEDIIDFRAAVEALTADGGGDGPEYALYAMKKVLEATETFEDGEEYDLMVEGSQMVVITDAPSKQTELTEEVIRLANTAGVCIHFFLSQSVVSDEYLQIDSQTSGTLISPFNNWDLATFIETYQTNPCVHLTAPDDRRRKRQAPVSYTSDSCATFQVSKLAVQLKLSINANTGSIVTITHSNSAISTVNVRSGNFAVFSEVHPQSGNWRACVNSGRLELSKTEVTSLDTSFFYLKEDTSDVTSTLPKACTPGQIVIASSQLKDIKSAELNIISKSGEVVKTMSMSQCSGSLVSDSLDFPLGEFTYQITGRDTSDISFKYDTRKNATFTYNPIFNRLFSMRGSSEVEMDPFGIITLTYRIYNNAPYSSEFRFHVQRLTGFATLVRTSRARVPAGESTEIEVLVRRTSSAIRRGTSHTLTVTASNDCLNISISTVLQIREEPTVPPTPSVAPSSDIEPGVTMAPPPPNDCGCVNGGTCVTTRRRGRTLKKCSCPPFFRGSKCQIDTRPPTVAPSTVPTTTDLPTTTLPQSPTTAEPTIVLTSCYLATRHHRLNIAYTERELDLEVTYLSDGSVDANSTAPSACSQARFVVNSKSADISTLKLLNSSSGMVAKEITLIKCSRPIFISNPVTFPTGEYTYYLVGSDTASGDYFEYNFPDSVTFANNDAGSFTFTDTRRSDSIVDIESLNTITLAFHVQIQNNNPYSSLFEFHSEPIAGFTTEVTRPTAPSLIEAKSTDRVQVKVRIESIDSSLPLGSIHAFAVTTSNGCSQHSTPVRVRIR